MCHLGALRNENVTAGDFLGRFLVQVLTQASVSKPDPLNLASKLKATATPDNQGQGEGEHEGHRCPADGHDEGLALHSGDDDENCSRVTATQT